MGKDLLRNGRAMETTDSELYDAVEALATAIALIASYSDREQAARVWTLIKKIEGDYLAGGMARNTLEFVRERVAESMRVPHE